MHPEKAAFAFQQRRLLLHRLIAPWRRRGATLLQAGLAGGLTPDFFWEAGFDVSALDADPALLEAVRDTTGPRVDYFQGKPFHLPFDDKSFDYVVLAHLCGSGATVPPASETTAEAARVAARGVIILEWNRLSLAWLGNALPPGGHICPWTLALLGREMTPPGGMVLRSVLSLPALFWPKNTTRCTRTQRMLRAVHDVVLSVPIGGVSGLRLEFSPLLPAATGILTVRAMPGNYAGAAMPCAIESLPDGKNHSGVSRASSGSTGEACVQK